MSYLLVQRLRDFVAADPRAAKLTNTEILTISWIADRASHDGPTANQAWDCPTWNLGKLVRGSRLRDAFRSLARKGLEVRVQRGVDAKGNPVFAVRGSQLTYQVPACVVAYQAAGSQDGAVQSAPKRVEPSGDGAAVRAPSSDQGSDGACQSAPSSDQVEECAVQSAHGAVQSAPNSALGAVQSAPLKIYPKDLKDLKTPPTPQDDPLGSRDADLWEGIDLPKTEPANRDPASDLAGSWALAYPCFRGMPDADRRVLVKSISEAIAAGLGEYRLSWVIGDRSFDGVNRVGLAAAKRINDAVVAAQSSRGRTSARGGSRVVASVVSAPCERLGDVEPLAAIVGGEMWAEKMAKLPRAATSRGQSAREYARAVAAKMRPVAA